MIFSEFYKYSFFQRIPILSNENNKRFSLSADGAFVLHFEKGETFPLFSFPKRKKFQKRSWRPCRSNACECGNCILQSSVVSARTPARAQNCPLAENAEVFGRHSVLWRTLIVWRLFWCADGITSPPRAYFIPSELVRQFRYLSFYRILLQKPIGG